MGFKLCYIVIENEECPLATPTIWRGFVRYGVSARYTPSPHILHQLVSSASIVADVKKPAHRKAHRLFDG